MMVSRVLSCCERRRGLRDWSGPFPSSKIDGSGITRSARSSSVRWCQLSEDVDIEISMSFFEMHNNTENEGVEDGLASLI